MTYTARTIVPFSIIIALLSLNGCLSSIHQPDKITESESSGFMPIHGHFCGPGHPKLFTVSKRDRIQELENIKPFDDIDASCKRHDICYEQNGFGNNACDRKLINDLKALRLNWPCSSLRLNITFYFAITSDYMSPYPTDTTGGKILNAASIPIRLVVMGAALGMHTLYGYNQPAHRFEECNNMSQ